MGAGANGLLVVGVVVPITCDTTTTDGGQLRRLRRHLRAGRRSFAQHGAARASGASTKGAAPPPPIRPGTATPPRCSTAPNWATGYSGDSVEGNGTTSYVQANIGTWFGANNTLSVSAWTYVNANSNGPVVGIAGTSGGWNMPFLSVRGSTVYGWLWGVPGTDQTTSPLSATVSLNAWHFLAITYDPNGGGAGVGKEIFYVDGVASGLGHRNLLAVRDDRHLHDANHRRQAERRRHGQLSCSARSTRCAPTTGL